MIEFSGNTGRKTHVAFIRKHGLGLLRSSADFRPPRPGIPWVLDNGAFSVFKQGRAWEDKDGAKFLKVLGRIREWHSPLMVVCPDKVAGGMESLAFSQVWRDNLSKLGYDHLPWYLAVQDGMDAGAVGRELGTGRWAGVFIGGTVAWKIKTAPTWVWLAHNAGLKVHIGRIAQPEFLAWARDIGADSVDSTTWARHDAHHLVLEGRRTKSLAGSWMPSTVEAGGKT